MKFNSECLCCNVRVLSKIAKEIEIDSEIQKNLLRKVLIHLSEVSYEQTNPEIMTKTWEIVTQGIGDGNPYKYLKSEMNQTMLKIYNQLYPTMKADLEGFKQGVHLAVEGNLIDLGASHNFSVDDLVNQMLSHESDQFTIDESEILYNQLKSASKLLYIGDNCGEIVMDKLLIQLIQRACPNLDIIYGVRGKAILNDITMEDAIEVGMNRVVKVIDSGDGAPGTVLNKVSGEFKKTFSEADVIISKGQGNYESLSILKDPRTFYLFMAKCEIVSDDVGVPIMSKLCTRVY